MSVLSTLALLATAASARIKPKPDPRVAELEAQIAKIAEDRDMWRDRAMRPVAEQQDAIERQARIMAAAMQSQQLQWAMHQSQQNAQLAQYHHQASMQQNLQNGQMYGQGLQMLGGAQALNPELWCNCVPSRSQVWAAMGGQ
jgi:hypothetical protein